MELYSFLLLFLLLLISTHFLLRLAQHRHPSRKRLPPGPIGLPIMGDLITIGDRPHESLAKLAKIHGPLMTVKLGFTTTVVASSTEMAKEILQKNDQAFIGRPVPDAVTAENGYDVSMAWLPGGPKWTNLRKLCACQVFTTQRLDALQSLRHQMVDQMVKRVTDATINGEELHIGKLVFGTNLNLLSNSMFSDDILDPKLRANAIEELKELIWKIMELAGKPNLADCFPFLKPFDPQGIRRKIKVSYDRLHALLDEIIDRRLKHRENGMPRRDDFLDVLLDHTQEKENEDFRTLDVKVLLTDLFIGGTDTTTTTIEWAMAELLKNPIIMIRAKEELASIIGSGQSVREQDITKLHYLQAVIKETMRLHPTAPLLLPHRAETEIEVCGYTIPKHTQIFVNTWCIGRDPKYWDNPTAFDPERFMNSEIDFRGNNFAFTPFGSGRRICPGLVLGVRMVSLLLASLLQGFDWKLPSGIVPEDIDMKDKFGITLQKAVPIVAIPVTN